MKTTYKRVLSGISLVAIAAVFMAFPVSAQESHYFLLEWRTWGRPTNIGVDSARQYVYVAQHCNNRIQKFDANGNHLQVLSVSYPRGVDTDSLGNVYVVESSYPRIKKFDANGNFIGAWGSRGTGDGEFMFPWGIAVDSLDNVYVADTGNHRIQKFDSQGNFITKWGSKGFGDGQFKRPTGIAVDATGNVYVADTDNFRIQKFDADGNFILKWGSFGPGEGQLYFAYGVAVDSEGITYTVEQHGHRIQKFSPDGILLGWWGKDNAGNTGWHEPGSGLRGVAGTGPGQFYQPLGIAFDSSTGNFYAADTANFRVQKFGPPPCEPVTENAAIDAACCVTNGIYVDPATGLAILGTYTGNFDEEIDPRKATHGSYVSCVAHMVNQLRREGEISKSEGGKIVRAAGQSDVNKPEGSIH